jgi:hypothetical protein
MTVKTDIVAVTPTATSKAVFASKGATVSGMLTQLQQMAAEMQILAKQIIAYSPNDSVLSATVASGGSGGTNGQVAINGTTGSGTKFSARGNISGGALSGALTIVTPGSYSIDPTSLSAEPVTGGGLTGATVALTMSGDNAFLTSLNSILAELI